MKRYAAYDENGIWGIGETPEAARADAIYWAYSDDERQSEEAQAWRLDTAHMTDRLAARVGAHGFDCNRDNYVILPDGTLDLPQEDSVQMIERQPWEEQGLVEYNGEPEDLEEWLESINGEYDVTVESDGVRGWDEYTHLVRLTPVDGDGSAALYYLVTSEVVARLRYLDLVALGDVAKLAGVETDTVSKWLARHTDFPVPVAETSAGRIWQQADVIKWLRVTGRM